MDQVTALFAQWAHYFLAWVGFGTLVGLLAKAIFPGRDPGGAFATLMIGVLGSIIGAGVVMFFTSQRVMPISVIGFPVAIIGTSLILLTYRVLNGKGIFKEGLAGFKLRRGRRKISVIEEKQ